MIDERTQLGRHIAAIGKIEEEPRKGGQVLVQSGDQLAASDVWAKRLLKRTCDSAARERSPDHQIQIVRGDLRLDGDVERDAIFLELPSIRGGTWRRTPADTAMMYEVPGVAGNSMDIGNIQASRPPHRALLW